MNKILLTGSHGYIGNHLRHIISGFDCIDIQLGNDILDPDLDISQYDTIIHLAAWVQVGQSVENPTDYYHNNINGTLNLLKKFQGSHFIFASTGAAANSLNSPYAISKKVCEDIIQEQAIKNGFNFTIFRFFNVIGSAFGLNPTNPDGLFHALKTAQSRGYFNIYGHDYNTPDGTCVRDYVHVMEICGAIKNAIGNPSNSIESLGHGIGYSVKEIVELYKKINNLNFEIKYLSRRDGDLEISVLDNVSTYLPNLYSIETMLLDNTQ